MLKVINNVVGIMLLASFLGLAFDYQRNPDKYLYQVVPKTTIMPVEPAFADTMLSPPTQLPRITKQEHDEMSQWQRIGRLGRSTVILGILYFTTTILSVGPRQAWQNAQQKWHRLTKEIEEQE